VLVENLQVQLIRPPVLVRPGPTSQRGGRGGDCRVLAFTDTPRLILPARHVGVLLSFLWWLVQQAFAPARRVGHRGDVRAGPYRGRDLV